MYLCIFFHISILDDFLQVIKGAHQTPVEKFEFPQTEAQEIGWSTSPLVRILNSSFIIIILSYFVQLLNSSKYFLSTAGKNTFFTFHCSKSSWFEQWEEYYNFEFIFHCF